MIKDLSTKVREEKVFISGVLHFSAEKSYTKYEICRKFVTFIQTGIDLSFLGFGSHFEYPFSLFLFVEVISQALGTSLDHLKPISTEPTDAASTFCHQLYKLRNAYRAE